MDYSSSNEKPGYEIIWKIENFLLGGQVHYNALRSPVFEVKLDESSTEYEMQLLLETLDICLGCYVRIFDVEKPEEISAGLEVSCVAADGKFEPAFLEEEVRVDRGKKCGAGFNNQWIYREMVTKKRSLYFPGDSFTIRCRIFPLSPQIYFLVKYFAVTHIGVERIVCERNFQTYRDFLSHYESKRKFVLCDESGIVLQREDSENLSIEFTRKEIEGKKYFRLVCELSVLDFYGVSLPGAKTNYCKNEYIIETFCFPDFTGFQELKSIAFPLNDALNLKFEFTMDTGCTYGSIIETKFIQPRTVDSVEKCSLSSLNRDLEALYLDKKFTDIQLRSGNEKLLAHKAILCARSPVFAAMFNNEMTEKESGVVHIDDVDITTLDKLLFFVYTGTANGLDQKMAMKLMSAADKYEVLPLKRKCAAYLQSIISMQNACLILHFADTYREELLKKAAQEFICSHHRTILLSDEWQQFLRDSCALASEIIHKLSVMYSHV